MVGGGNVGAAHYWRTRGKERFARELGEDGLPPYEVAALLDRIELDLFKVDLDEVLRRLRERETRTQEDATVDPTCLL